MNQQLLKEFVTGVIRHGFTTLGGVLVAQGYLDANNLQQAAAGATMIVVGLLWSLWRKYDRTQIGA